MAWQTKPPAAFPLRWGVSPSENHQAGIDMTSELLILALEAAESGAAHSSRRISTALWAILTIALLLSVELMIWVVFANRSLFTVVRISGTRSE